MSFDIFTIAGVAGAGTIILAYFLIQQGWLEAKGWRYSTFNLVGATLILISLYTQWNLPSAVIEVFWISISLYGIGKQILHPDSD